LSATSGKFGRQSRLAGQTSRLVLCGAVGIRNSEGRRWVFRRPSSCMSAQCLITWVLLKIAVPKNISLTRFKRAAWRSMLQRWPKLNREIELNRD